MVFSPRLSLGNSRGSSPAQGGLHGLDKTVCHAEQRHKEICNPIIAAQKETRSKGVMLGTVTVTASPLIQTL